MIANPPSEEVLKVCEWIRSQVPRPNTLPARSRSGLRWQDGCCPLGLLQSATISIPINSDDFDETPPRPDWELEAFWTWWDDLADGEAKAAMNFVWPPKVNDGS